MAIDLWWPSKTLRSLWWPLQDVESRSIVLRLGSGDDQRLEATQSFHDVNRQTKKGSTRIQQQNSTIYLVSYVTLMTLMTNHHVDRAAHDVKIGDVWTRPMLGFLEYRLKPTKNHQFIAASWTRHLKQYHPPMFGETTSREKPFCDTKILYEMPSHDRSDTYDEVEHKVIVKISG